MQSQLTLSIHLLTPPPNIMFCIQKGKDKQEQVVTSTGKDIEFTVPFRVKQKPDGTPNFLGDYAQGPASQRFFYICVGEYAGQKNTEWARRVKIHLRDITWDQVEKVVANPKLKLKASYEATDSKGEPSCASVPLINGWVIGK